MDSTQEVRPRHRGSCHCGGVTFEVMLPHGLVDPHHCDCSLCRRRGAIVVTVPLDDLLIIEGADLLSLYQFNTKTAKHYFCSRCGIYTHHQRRSNPEEYSVNLGCLEGIVPFVLEPVPVNDGIHHPKDRVDVPGHSPS